MARNEIVRSGATAPNPTERGMSAPKIPPSQAAVVGQNNAEFEAAQVAHKEQLFAGRLRAERER
jgi:hypothetical protein